MRSLLAALLLLPSLAWAGPHMITLSDGEEQVLAEAAKNKGESVDALLQQLVSAAIAGQIQMAQMQTLSRLQQRAWAGDKDAQRALDAALKAGLVVAPLSPTGPIGATPPTK